MSKIIPKSGMGRVCMISFILLCCVFTSENAFSRRHWSMSYMDVTYDRKDNSINIKFLVYDYCIAYNNLATLDWCDFYYCVNGIEDRTLFMSSFTKTEQVKDYATTVMKRKEPDEDIWFFSHDHPQGIKWPNVERIPVKQKLTNKNFLVSLKEETSNIAEMRVKWYLPKPSKPIEFIHVFGLWASKNKRESDTISAYYPVKTVTSNSKAMDDSSVLKPEINNNVKVTGETDAINVTGAEPGENIKIYTASGVEVKSVVATDDVVNIKLPTNQIYIVKAGQAHQKVAL